MKGKFLAAGALIAAAVSCGCTAGRSVSADNTLKSGFPRFEMKVASDFSYAGKERKSEEVMAQVRYSMIQVNTERDYFVAAGADRNLRRFLIVQTENLLHGYLTLHPEKVPNKLEAEEITLGGKQFTSFTRLAAFSCRPDGDEVSRFLCGKGYIPPQCGLLRTASRIEGMDGEILLEIAYFEDLKESVEPSCVQWIQKERLTPVQLDHLKGFTERFGTAFSMSD